MIVRDFFPKFFLEFFLSMDNSVVFSKCPKSRFTFFFSVPTWSAQATTAGGIEFEKRYGLALCLSKSMRCWLPEVYPPAAPPRALPRVELIMSTLPGSSPEGKS